MSAKRRVVYSTDSGRHCPDCGEPVARCRCSGQGQAPDAGDGIVRLKRESKGRAGKPVVIVTGLALSPDELKKLARHLKSKCGVGGTVEDGNIIIQGDKRDRIKTELESMGHTVKISGG